MSDKAYPYKATICDLPARRGTGFPDLDMKAVGAHTTFRFLRKNGDPYE